MERRRTCLRRASSQGELRQRTLDRGYAVIRAEGTPVTTRAAAATHPALEIEFADGRLDVATNAAPLRRKPKGGTPPDAQGSLF